MMMSSYGNAFGITLLTRIIFIRPSPIMHDKFSLVCWIFMETSITKDGDNTVLSNHHINAVYLGNWISIKKIPWWWGRHNNGKPLVGMTASLYWNDPRHTVFGRQQRERGCADDLHWCHCREAWSNSCKIQQIGHNSDDASRYHIGTSCKITSPHVDGM